MTEPLRVSFEVRTGADHAFATWTERMSLWWPPDHTMTGSPAGVVLEGRVGGRIYERGAQGEEHEWGVVTEWRPPDALAFRWHLGVGPERATDVAITFRPVDADTTRVEIEQSGWERLGADAPALRERNLVGWGGLEPHFRAAVEAEAQEA
jgi:hypothetical protein